MHVWALKERRRVRHLKTCNPIEATVRAGSMRETAQKANIRASAHQAQQEFRRASSALKSSNAYRGRDHHDGRRGVETGSRLRGLHGRRRALPARGSDVWHVLEQGRKRKGPRLEPDLTSIPRNCAAGASPMGFNRGLAPGRAEPLITT
jgi:hypothetical protein